MDREPLTGKTKHIDFIILDIICMQVCFVLAHWFISGIGSPYTNGSYLFQASVLVLSQLLAIWSFNHYKNILKRNRKGEISSIIKQTLSVFFISLVILFATHKTINVSRLQVAITLILYIIIDYQLHQGNKIRILKHGNHTDSGRSIVLFTSGSLADEAMKNLTKANPYIDYFISAIVLTDRDSTSVTRKYSVPILNLDDNAIAQVRGMWVDEALIIQPDKDPIDKSLIYDLSQMGITINICYEFMNNRDWPSVEMKKIGIYKVFSSNIKFITTKQAISKRVLDIAGGLVGCAMTGILYIIIAPIIYQKSPGPIFFSQERIGKNGKVFKIYKFRSMYLDAEERRKELKNINKNTNGLIFKIVDDPRIIGSETKDKYGNPKGIGNFIRNTSIDEFPQFWNVLRGDMSLVGTRPPLPDEWELYELHHRARMSIKPGITGPWQVNGRSEITDFEEIVRLDREYIENWSILLDMQMILKTISVVIKKTGAV